MHGVQSTQEQKGSKVKNSRLSVYDSVHVGLTTPMSAEELSAVFLKSRASVLVSLQGRHMGVETSTARGSISDPWRIGQ